LIRALETWAQDDISRKATLNLLLDSWLIRKLWQYWEKPLDPCGTVRSFLGLLADLSEGFNGQQPKINITVRGWGTWVDVDPHFAFNAFRVEYFDPSKPKMLKEAIVGAKVKPGV